MCIYIKLMPKKKKKRTLLANFLNRMNKFFTLKKSKFKYYKLKSPTFFCIKHSKKKIYVTQKPNPKM